MLFSNNLLFTFNVLLKSVNGFGLVRPFHITFSEKLSCTYKHLNTVRPTPFNNLTSYIARVIQK